ncbi:hypothetical protein HMPREF0063_11576 [Aeromicrobium marinum DSM 15272]|uniref:DUF5667 domain-containing protein n=1 Tax=Aeromicrobium marinum DSM 15272 TaxID=585531 RepID=E2SC17_9ACTN|nr:DUF5667 domain-containing protein [Aeromicrobium marinum]EFQ83303.1 hypothetical protein HMPREF0063_11576 [Aeromicrobium marinum DSM 15272]
MIRRDADADAFESALRGRHVADAELRHLVRHAEHLCATAAQHGPSDDFRSSLRDRLMTEAATALEPRAAVPRRAVAPAAPGFRRRVARVSAAAIVAVGGVGLVASSAQAVPGDMLYAVKRGVENVEMALQRTETSRGELQLSQAGERLAEAARLAEVEGGGTAFTTSLKEFRSDAVDGSERLFDDFESSGDGDSIRSVAAFTEESSAVLADIIRVAGPGNESALELTALTITDLAAQARDLCATCADGELSDMVVVSAPTAANPSTSSPLPTPVPVLDDPPAEVSVAPRPGPSPTAAAPVPSPSRPAPSPSPIADLPEVPVVTPLLGSLLGDDTQEGLVPGLLGGLLGRS